MNQPLKAIIYYAFLIFRYAIVLYFECIEKGKRNGAPFCISIANTKFVLVFVLLLKCYRIKEKDFCFKRMMKWIISVLSLSPILLIISTQFLKVFTDRQMACFHKFSLVTSCNHFPRLSPPLTAILVLHFL